MPRYASNTIMRLALAIERNAQAKLRSVKGLGRSFSWADYLAQRDYLPLFDDQDVAPTLPGGFSNNVAS